MDYLSGTKEYVQKKVQGNEKQTVAIVISTISGLVMLGKYMKRRKLQQQLERFEQESAAENKVILHGTPPWTFPTPHASPYVAKVIAFCAYNKIPYKLDTTAPLHFYTQKMPWITYKQHHQPDSNLIIKWFAKQKEFHNINMDSHLSEQELALCTAFKSAIEDGLGPVIGYRRWYDDENREKYRELLFLPMMSPFLSKVIMRLVSNSVKKALWMTGIARFKEEEVYEKGEELIESVVVNMRGKKFFFGDKLSTLDLTIYAMLGGMYQLCSVMTWGVDKSLPAKLPHSKEVNEYMKRVEMECFGELKYWKDIA